MTLNDRIEGDLKEALRAGEARRLSTLRLLKSEIHNAEIAAGGPLDDSGVEEVIRREVKKRKQSIDSFRESGREDRAADEEAEREILERYLPAQLSDEELSEAVDRAIQEIGSSPERLGQIIGRVRSEVGGRAEGGRVAEQVKARLGS